MDDNATVPWPDGTTKTGAQVKALWAAMDFVMTDVNYGDGRGGKVIGSTSYMNFDTWNGWAANPSGSLFIVLHELVHTDPAIKAFVDAKWSTHLNSEYALAAARLGKPVGDLTASERAVVETAALSNYSRSTPFSQGEARANSGAYQAAQILRVAIAPALAPPHGRG